MKLKATFRSALALLALAFIAAVALQPTTQAHAQVLENAVTDVKINQASVANGTSSLTVRVDFKIGAGIGQGGTARAGDEFWVDFDPELAPQPSTFPIYAQGAPGVVVATVTVAPSPRNSQAMRATFVVTNYVEPRTSTTGWAQWNINFADKSTSAGEKDLVFTTASTTFSDTVTVQNQTPSGPEGPALPSTNVRKYGVWGNGSQTSIAWVVMGGAGPLDQFILDDYAPTDAFGSALWEFNCAPGGYYFLYLSTITGDVQNAPAAPETTCSPEHAHFVINNVPENVVVYMQFGADVTDTRPQGSLTFTNTGTITKNTLGTIAEESSGTGSITQTFSSGAVGPTVPVSPRVTEAVCNGPGTNTTPKLETPPNGSGVRYSVSGTPVAGGSAVVTATLDESFSWDDGAMPAGWKIVDDTTATFTVNFNQPDCSNPTTVTNPIVSQVTCVAAGEQHGFAGITLPANTDGVTYTLQGNPAPGATVTVVATLTDGHLWESPTPAGWVLNTGNNTATYTVTFDDPNCDETTSPLDPSVTQSHCLAPGQNSAPQLALAPNGDGIMYTAAGDVATGATVTVTATLQNGYVWDDSMPTGWTIKSDTTATFTVTFTTPNCVETSTPLDPSVTQAHCLAPGQNSAPQLALAPNGDGIMYTAAGDVATGETVTVTATLQNGYAWDDSMPTGWTIKSDTTATFTVTFTTPNCVETSTPLSPQIHQAYCVAVDEPSSPNLVLAADQDGISYSASGPAAQGSTVVVTAQLAPGYAWPPTLPTGWSLAPDNTATYTVIFDTIDCVGHETLLVPQVVQSVCSAPGQLTAPIVSVPANQDHIEYTMSGDVVAGGTVIITATAENGYDFNPGSPAGWVVNDNRTSATFTVILDTPSCVETSTPLNPQVTQSVCLAPGNPSTPVVTPAHNGDGITYSVSDIAVGDTSATVTATLANGYEWEPTLPQGWQIGDGNTKTATYTVTLSVPSCVETSTPLNPQVTQSVCLAPGNPSTPVVTPAHNGDGITYSVSDVAVGDTSATVTATLANGYEWEPTLPQGWQIGDGNTKTATYTVTLSVPSCVETTTPGVPFATQAVCLAPGDTQPPTLLVPENRDGVVYQVAGDVALGETVVVTATLTPGYEWDTDLHEGWKFTGVTGTATYTVVFENIDCVVSTTPVSPLVVQAQCLAVPGASTEPELTLAPNGDGIVYTQTGVVEPGNTVSVTATLEAGYRWAGSLPEGWVVNGSVASFDAIFEPIDCTLYTAPVAPGIAQAVCTTPGHATLPTVSHATNTTGVVYTTVGEVIPGATVTVVATLETGFGWNGSLPEGWIMNSANNTAEYTFTLDTIDCVIDVTPPAAPTVVQASCGVPGVVTAPKLTLPQSTPGITYAQHGSLKPGETVIVSAHLSDGYRWAGALKPGWSAQGGSTISFSAVFDQVACTGLLLSTTGMAGLGVAVGLMIPALLTAAGVAFALQRSRNATADVSHTE